MKPIEREEFEEDVREGIRSGTYEEYVADFEEFWADQANTH